MLHSIQTGSNTLSAFAGGLFAEGLCGCVWPSCGVGARAFPGCGVLWAVSGVLWTVYRVGGLTRVPRLPGFILLVSFSDTLLVASILDMVYDCHLWLLLWSWGWSCWRFLWELWVIFGLGMALSGLWGVLWAVPKVGGLARACPFLGFILLVGFGGTFLVVSILGVVYDCH